MAVARTGLTLPQISCFTLSFTCFSSDSDNCPRVGIGLLLQFSHLPRAGPILLTLLFVPLAPFILLSFTWFYIFFSTGQILLSALSWCSACTSVSEGIFLMYPWEEMYTTSTYSSAILLSHNFFLIILILDIITHFIFLNFSHSNRYVSYTSIMLKVKFLFLKSLII